MIYRLIKLLPLEYRFKLYAWLVWQDPIFLGQRAVRCYKCCLKYPEGEMWEVDGEWACTPCWERKEPFA